MQFLDITAAVITPLSTPSTAAWMSLRVQPGRIPLDGDEQCRKELLRTREKRHA
jgi:hypothetical protein